jgi:hypothetical protein
MCLLRFAIPFRSTIKPSKRVRTEMFRTCRTLKLPGPSKRPIWLLGSGEKLDTYGDNFAHAASCSCAVRTIEYCCMAARGPCLSSAVSFAGMTQMTAP